MAFDEWKVPVSNWAAWGLDSASGDPAPDLSYVEPMLRRRLSPLARITLHVAAVCAGERTPLSMVYASRHGELGRTLETLRQVASSEPLSPAAFSLSVLNSAAGVYSIARQEHAPATAISAGAETFGFGLLEAASRFWENRETPVLYVYADAATPEPLPAQAGDPTDRLALAILIDATAERTLCVSTAMRNGEASPQPQALACFNALTGAGSSWSSGRRAWTMRLA